MRLSEDELKVIEERAALATPGPWEASDNHITIHGVGAVEFSTDNPMLGDSSNDTTFIAHAREDVPRMAKDIRRLHSLLERAARSLDYPDWLERELDLYIFGKSDIPADND